MIDNQNNTYIRVSGLNKQYEGIEAVKDINFHVNKGEIFGFIGPDGAGKTTIFRILATLLLPDSGRVLINHYDAVSDYRKIRKMIGYMPGRFSLYKDLTVIENLEFFATVFGTSVEENYYLIKDIYAQIEPFKNRKANALSGGMKQKLALSCALIHKPEFLVLDEPTTGVDAVSRKEFWEMLKKLREYNITIIVSTPYMDEAGLCERVALIQNGNIMQVDTPEKIVSGFRHVLYSVSSKENYRLLKDLREFEGTRTVFPYGQDLHLTLKKDSGQEDIMDYVRKKGHENFAIQEISAGIEDCFMDLMN